jgi:multiple antibiotic resistance protein
MPDFLRYLPHTFIPLFVAIDIVAVLPVYASLTRELTASSRKGIARESIVTALLVGVLFIGMGEGIFSILGITGNDFKIAGGIVLLVFAVLDLIRRDGDARKPPARFGVVPIGVPLIVGPAVLTTLLVLVDHYGVLVTTCSFILNLGIVWILFEKASSIVKFLGEGGIVALSKIVALLLASIAVMMIRIGLQNILAH